MTRLRQLSRITLLSCGLALMAFTGADGTVKVYAAGGYEEIRSRTENGIEYISLSELANIVGGSLDWQIVGHQIVYETDSYRFEFLVQSPLFKLNDTIYNLTYPASLDKGQLLVPAVTLVPFLDRVHDHRISFDAQSGSLRIDSEYFNVTDISFSPKANGFLIEIYLTAALPYDVWITEGNWINVSIRGGFLNQARIRSRADRRYMYSLKAHQLENSNGQVSVRLRKTVDKWHHKLVQDPPRIQISIADVNFEMDTSLGPELIGPDDKIDVIVIDAGHGGKDNGAIGQRGAREKDVALTIAKKLAQLIRKDKQFKVIMTRDRDKTVTLEERAAVANNAGTDLFISVHANASHRHRIRGWNVFFLAPARNDSARAVAQLENSYFLRERTALDAHTTALDDPTEIDPVLGILNEMIMTEFQTESHDFAMMVDREFRRDLKIPARGVDQAGFFVLNRVFTPSVLIEAGFISNRTEEKLLRDKKYQQKVAEGLYRAIKRFKAKYESM